jgi:hypothetical protein
MKPTLPEPVHESYKRHRKQRANQILLPVILAAVLFVGLIVLVNIATFGYNGDVGRWAAISTMWISIPVCLTGFVFLIILVGMVYLMGRLLGVAPAYTLMAQHFVQKLGIRIRLLADKVVQPVFAVNGFGATIKALLGRK